MRRQHPFPEEIVSRSGLSVLKSVVWVIILGSFLGYGL